MGITCALWTPCNSLSLRVWHRTGSYVSTFLRSFGASFFLVSLRIAQVYQFDHQFPTTVGSDVPLVVLYGELGTPEFARLHSTLSEMAASERIQYVFRHYYKVRVVAIFTDTRTLLLYVMM